MKKLFAAVTISTLLAGSVFCGSICAEEAESAQAVEQEATEVTSRDETEAAGLQTEAVSQTEEILSIPQDRPEYNALDYVKITDDEYKKISFSAYPPVDDSEQAQMDYQTTVDTMIMSYLFSLYPIEEIPEDLLNYTAGSLTETYQQYAKMYGMDFGTFLQTYLQKDETTFKAQVEKAAEQTLKEEMLLKAVAEKENITVSDEEYEQGCAEYAVRYGYESPDALKQAFDESTIRVSLLMDKTFEYLESVTTVNLIIETETESESLTEGELPAETPQTPAVEQTPAAEQDPAAEQTPAAEQDPAAEQTPTSEAAAVEPVSEAAAAPDSEQTGTSENAA